MRRTNLCTNPDKRSAILNAARARFSRYGLSKVTMDEIAADLGMSKAALYYYFATKEEMFRQVIAQERQDFVSRIESIIAHQCASSEKLGAYFAEHLTLLGTLLDLRILSTQAGDAIHPIMRALFKEFNRRETSLLEIILREGRKRKEFRLDFPAKTALFVQHVLVGLRIRFFKSIQDREFGKADIRVYKNEISYFSKIFIQGISH